MKQSNLYRLNWLDLGKGLLVAIIVLVLNFAQETLIPAMEISPKIKLMLITGIGYLIKNFFTKPTI